MRKLFAFVVLFLFLVQTVRSPMVFAKDPTGDDALLAEIKSEYKDVYKRRDLDLPISTREVEGTIFILFRVRPAEAPKKEQGVWNNVAVMVFEGNKVTRGFEIEPLSRFEFLVTDLQTGDVEPVNLGVHLLESASDGPYGCGAVSAASGCWSCAEWEYLPGGCQPSCIIPCDLACIFLGLGTPAALACWAFCNFTCCWASSTICIRYEWVDGCEEITPYSNPIAE